MKRKFETMKEFLKRGGKVILLPEEREWDIIPLEEKVRLKSAVETLDYERDYRPKWSN